MTTPDRGEILRAIAQATTLGKQAQLVALLDEHDRAQTRTAAQDRGIDWANTVVGEKLRPHAAFEFTSAASDWLVDLEEPDVDHSKIVAQAALWFSKLVPAVRADAQECAEQARGHAQRLASSYGAGAGEAEQIFTDYTRFLQHQAASGLDQIQQSVAPDGSTQKSTPLPPEVFDNFAPEVDPVNSGVVGTESSERNPLLQEISGGGSGSGTPEVPGGHSTTDDLSWSPPGGGEHKSPTPGGGSGMDSGGPEIAGGHGGSDQDGGVDERGRRAEAASSLPQIQQTVDVHDQNSTTPMPTTVAFPWEMGGHEDGLAGEAHYDQGESVPSRHTTTAARQVTADQWSAPHQTVQPNIANSPASTPPARPGTAAEGAADGADPNSAAPSFSDAHATPAYDQAYTHATPPSRPKDVPVVIGGDNGQSLSHTTYASQHIASAQDMQREDFQRGYRYAARWEPGTPVVTQGSAELEAGIYAGWTDHPQHRGEWLAAHERLSTRLPVLGRRIALHRQYTAKVALARSLETDGTYLQALAATSTDLDTMAPGTSPDPTGGTPINGPGRPGPLAGGSDAAAAGGPAPYNGAAPMGSPVVPSGAPAAEPNQATIPDTGMSPPQMSLPEVSAVFRRRVQAGLLAERNHG